MLKFALAPWRRAPVSPSPIVSVRELEGDAVLEVFIVEIHYIALHIAAICSFLNWTDDYSEVLRSDIKQYLPECSEASTLAVLFKSKRSPEAEAAANLLHLMQTLIEPTSKLEGFLTTGGNFRGRNSKYSTFSQCRDSWHQVAKTTLDMVNYWEPLGRWRLSDRLTDNSLLLVRLLRSVLRGDAPCVDGDGNIFLANLPQGRRSPRYSLKQRCSLVWRGRKFSAFARDISGSGIGLAECPVVPLKEWVDIYLKAGDHLRGQVVWSDAGKLGVKFDEPIPPERMRFK